MDPYLEAHWGDIHTSLIVYARDQIQDQLPDGLLARVEESVSIDLEGIRRTAFPDVKVVKAPSVSRGTAPGSATAVLAEPILIPVRDEPMTERHIEIVDTTSGHHVVTAIEFLSPVNKGSAEGRAAYRRKQRNYIAGGVHLVEVDLIRDGEFVLAVPLERVPVERRRPYAVCIRRASDPDQAAFYPLPLRERLPAVPIPLRPTDEDVTLDLQELIDLCYHRGHYASTDYSGEPSPRLSADDAAWADALLRAAGRR
jgi:hypothetical protein